MRSLIFKCTEMCSLIENVLINLLNVALNYLSKHSLPNCMPIYLHKVMLEVLEVVFTHLMHNYAELGP